MDDDFHPSDAVDRLPRNPRRDHRNQAQVKTNKRPGGIPELAVSVSIPCVPSADPLMSKKNVSEIRSRFRDIDDYQLAEMLVNLANYADPMAEMRYLADRSAGMIENAAPVLKFRLLEIVMRKINDLT